MPPRDVRNLPDCFWSVFSMMRQGATIGTAMACCSLANSPRDDQSRLLPGGRPNRMIAFRFFLGNHQARGLGVVGCGQFQPAADPLGQYDRRCLLWHGY